MHGREQDGDWADLVHSNEVGHPGLGGVEYPGYVFDQFLPCRDRPERNGIRSAGTPAVHMQDASQCGHLLEEIRRLRNLPDEIDMSSEGVTKEEVVRAFAEDLVGDISISDAHIPNPGRLHRSDSLALSSETLPPAGRA